MRPPAYPSSKLPSVPHRHSSSNKTRSYSERLARTMLYAPVTTIDDIIFRYRADVKKNRRFHRKNPHGEKYINLPKIREWKSSFRYACGLADPRLNLAKRSVFWCTTRRVYSFLNAYSGCIARLWRRRMLYEAHGQRVHREPENIYVFERANEKRRRPSTSKTGKNL